MYKFWTVKIIRFIPLIFIFGVVIAMVFYPGGNIHNPEQIGYSFTNNFLSDLGGIKARSGDSNIISFLFFNASMLVFALGGVGFLFVPRLFKTDKVNYILALIGFAFFFFGALFFGFINSQLIIIYQKQNETHKELKEMRKELEQLKKSK